MVIEKKKFIDYSMIYLLVGFTGIDFFFRTGITFITFFAILFGIVFWYRKKRFDKFFLYYIAILLLFNFFQSIKFYYILGNFFWCNYSNYFCIFCNSQYRRKIYWLLHQYYLLFFHYSILFLFCLLCSRFRKFITNQNSSLI